MVLITQNAWAHLIAYDYNRKIWRQSREAQLVTYSEWGEPIEAGLTFDVGVVELKYSTCRNGNNNICLEGSKCLSRSIPTMKLPRRKNHVIYVMHVGTQVFHPLLCGEYNKTCAGSMSFEEWECHWRSTIPRHWTLSLNMVLEEHNLRDEWCWIFWKGVS